MRKMASCHSSSTPKIERRIIEKNRRNHMKGLYSKLYSLLPNHSSKEAIPLPDQIDEAVNYIKSLQAKLEKSKKKKETLSSTRKRSHTYTNESNISTLKSPKIEIHEMGHTLNVTLVTGHDDKFIFHEIIRLIHEDGVEVLSTNFSVIGNSIFHSIHAKAGESAPNFIATQVSNRLKEFVNATMSDVEESLQPESWEFKVQPNLYDLEIPHIGYRCL